MVCIPFLLRNRQNLRSFSTIFLVSKMKQECSLKLLSLIHSRVCHRFPHLNLDNWVRLTNRMMIVEALSASCLERISDLMRMRRHRYYSWARLARKMMSLSKDISVKAFTNSACLPCTNSTSRLKMKVKGKSLRVFLKSKSIWLFLPLELLPAFSTKAKRRSRLKNI